LIEIAIGRIMNFKPYFRPGAITAALYLKHFISAPKKTEESLARNKTEDEMSSDDLQDETNSKSSSEGILIIITS
jgi:hypothetical protein